MGSKLALKPLKDKQTQEKKSTLRCALSLLFSHGEKTRHHAKRRIARWISSLGSVYTVYNIHYRIRLPEDKLYRIIYTAFATPHSKHLRNIMTKLAYHHLTSPSVSQPEGKKEYRPVLRSFLVFCLL